MIHCLKEGEPCHNGKAAFNSQLRIINEHDTNPFACIPQPDDILAAAPEHQLIDEDEEEDELIVV